VKLFSKTYEKDYGWLKLAMKSVLKMCIDPVDWTVVGDRGSRPHLEAIAAQATQETGRNFTCHLFEAQEHWSECVTMNGYYSQQWIKMNAHKVMGNDVFWNWDCDVIAVKPFHQKTFIGKSGRPVHWISQFNALFNHRDHPSHVQRIEAMRDIIGFPEPSFEYMRCMPIPMFGQILKCGSERKEWQKSFQYCQRGDQRFSEFNIIGMFAHMFFPDAFEWKNAETEPPTWAGGYVEHERCFQAHATVCQSWSHGGIVPHIEEFVNNLQLVKVG